MNRLVSLIALATMLFPVRSDAKDCLAPLASGKDTTGNKAKITSCQRCIVITDQAEPAIDIIDLSQNGKILWTWNPGQCNIDSDKVKWFSNPDDAKPVYGGRFLLINASGGGVALVRISDKRAVFYAHAGVNPHSSALLPDGNIVTASSTDNRLVIFHVDTSQAPDHGYRRIVRMPFAHNVVWDKARKVLWSAGEGKLYKLGYNGDCMHPDLVFLDSLSLPGSESHDLFPVYEKDSLFLTNPDNAYYFNVKTKRLSPLTCYEHKNIKSLSSGPAGWPILVMIPKERWWSDEVRNAEGDILFTQKDMRIYKVRWFLPDPFSYSEADHFKQCAP